MAVATVGLEAGGVAELEHRLTAIFDQNNLAFEHVDEFVFGLVPVTQRQAAPGLKRGEIDAPRIDRGRPHCRDACARARAPPDRTAVDNWSGLDRKILNFSLGILLIPVRHTSQGLVAELCVTGSRTGDLDRTPYLGEAPWSSKNFGCFNLLGCLRGELDVHKRAGRGCGVRRVSAANHRRAGRRARGAGGARRDRRRRRLSLTI